MFSDYSSSANVFNKLKARDLNGKSKAPMLPNTLFQEYHLQVFNTLFQEYHLRVFNDLNVFNKLKARELNGKSKAPPPMLPNTVFQESHLQAFNNLQSISVTDMVIACDIILVVYGQFYFIPYLRPADGDGEVSALTDNNGNPVIMHCYNRVDFICYNSYNDSLLIVAGSSFKTIMSIPIALIKAGETTAYTRHFPSDSIYHCDFDIPNCRGMIYNNRERLFTIFELKEYVKLFTIPDESGSPLGHLHFRFLSPCNGEMVIYNVNNSSSGETSLKIYSKFNGRLYKQILLSLDPQYEIMFIVICGKDILLVQQEELNMQILNIATETPEIIKTTEIQAKCCPYYLDKREQFLCYTISSSLHVCNLRGDILFTFQEIQLSKNSLMDGLYITRAQDIFMCICPSEDTHDKSSINVLNIVTGECVAKIASDISHSSDMREAAVTSISAFAYDETNREIFTGNPYGICCQWSNRILEDIGDISKYLPFYLV